MYVSLGSRCDVCFEDDPWIGAVISATSEGKNAQVYSSGLRNAVFITINSETDKLWGTEMGRDFLGNNVPPDEINVLEKGKSYGWPVCYGDKVYDTNFGSQTAAYCEKTVAPAYKIPAHSAPLGLTFINSDKFPESWQGDLLVSYHGSWNSSVPVGYKVVRLDVEGQNVTNETDFITGFIDGSQAAGRPVDLIFDEEGYLFLSDDKRGVVYIVGN
jgi:glucose/arabinose dehydrogenase